MQNTWILVADAGRARLFAGSAEKAVLTELASFANPESRATDRVQKRDRLPRVNESVGSARHAIEPHTSLRKKNIDKFARSLGDQLERGRVEHRYDHLVLVAAPQFLGALHGVMDKELRKLVVAEVRRNLTTLPPDKIRDHLPLRSRV